MMADDVAETLPMFPLSTVLLPGTVLPLHVFEPRYRALMDEVMAGDRRFGVVLIERGHEVGGDDERAGTGTVASIVDTEHLPDGRWVVVAVGAERIRVVRWLPDDPYPRAEVEPWPDDVDEVPDGALDEVDRRLRRVHALARELGAEPPESFELADDPLAASYQATGLAGLGPLDAHRLLACPGPGSRLAQLRDLLAEQEEILRFRLGAS